MYRKRMRYLQTHFVDVKRLDEETTNTNGLTRFTSSVATVVFYFSLEFCIFFFFL